MLNNKEFSKRLQKVIDYHNESGSSFAEKIGVQRSSISHILSGRNKPSLDFIMKVLASYPDVDLYWMINGKGNFPKEETHQKDIKIEQKTQENNDSFLSKNEPENTPENEPEKQSNLAPKIQHEIASNLDLKNSPSQNQNNIDRIVIFYKNGSFKLYENF